MRLSTIFELLLILLLVAFAAYGRVIDRNEMSHRMIRAVDNAKQSDTLGLSTMSLKQATDSVNRYCTCNENICNCCRDFHIPLVQLKGPGCASLQYFKGDNLAVQLSFGDNILTSTVVNGKSPKPVCVPLPGGFTKFCGRIYSIQRDAKNHFKACLGLELQSATELEASLRVSCFRFGPDGLKLRPAEPLPDVETEPTEEDDDDDDDFFGLGTDDDDDDDDEDETVSSNSVPNASGVDNVQESDDDDDEDEDILGFSAILDIFTGDDDTPKRPKPTTAAPLLEFTIPILPRPTTATPLEDHELSTFANNELENNDEELEDSTHEPSKTEEEEVALTENNTEESIVDSQEQITEASNKIAYLAKPDKDTNAVKKGVIGEKKKPTVTSTSVNAIHDPEKPVKKPIKDENNEDNDDDDDILDDDDDEDDDDEDDEIDDDDDKDNEDENEEDEDKVEDEKHEEQDYDEDDKDLAALADDDDDEEEEAMLNAFMETGKSKKDKGNAKNQTNTDEDYSVEFLARKRHSSGSRQSKVMRF